MWRLPCPTRHTIILLILSLALIHGRIRSVLPSRNALLHEIANDSSTRVGVKRPRLSLANSMPYYCYLLPSSFLLSLYSRLNVALLLISHIEASSTACTRSCNDCWQVSNLDSTPSLTCGLRLVAAPSLACYAPLLLTHEAQWCIHTGKYCTISQ